MGLFTSINIAATGMSVERLRSDVISDNIANASTTRTQDGGAFKRSRVIVAEKVVALHLELLSFLRIWIRVLELVYEFLKFKKIEPKESLYMTRRTPMQLRLVKWKDMLKCQTSML